MAILCQLCIYPNVKWTLLSGYNDLFSHSFFSFHHLVTANSDHTFWVSLSKLSATNSTFLSGLWASELQALKPNAVHYVTESYRGGRREREREGQNWLNKQITSHKKYPNKNQLYYIVVWWAHYNTNVRLSLRESSQKSIPNRSLRPFWTMPHVG